MKTRSKLELDLWHCAEVDRNKVKVLPTLYVSRVESCIYLVNKDDLWDADKHICIEEHQLKVLLDHLKDI